MAQIKKKKTKNVGKRFEENWRDSIPADVVYHRLRDASQSFYQSEKSRFTLRNPFDCMLYYYPYLFCLELKSTGSGRISYEVSKYESGMIHYHQIQGLQKLSRYDGVIAGFLFNFRHRDGSETCYYQNIDNFLQMIRGSEKKSFNESDMKKHNALVVKSKKKRVNFVYDVGQFILDTIALYQCNKENEENGEMETRLND